MKESKFLNIAILAAKGAGQVHRKYFEQKISVLHKESAGRIHDIVTKADFEAEKKIISEIKSRFSDHNILTEESKQIETDSKYRWVIDPLDGTANFANHIPFFNISIALQQSSVTLMGVVYNPISNEMFVAQRGSGAYLNNKKLHVSNKDNINDALISVGIFPTWNDVVKEKSIQVGKILIDKARGLRLFGSHALELAYVSSGRLDASIYLSADVFGAMAGKLLVEEAGGFISDIDGNKLNDKPWGKNIPVIAIGRNPKLRNQILEVISSR